jgi:hypothetical protein
MLLHRRELVQRACHESDLLKVRICLLRLSRRSWLLGTVNSQFDNEQEFVKQMESMDKLLLG